MRPTVLIVDDDAAVRGLLVDLFEEEGYLVRSAANGAAALRVARDDPPDVVLTDVVMPEMDGQCLAGALAARRVPIILMSAARRDGWPPDVIFVPKPFDIEKILAVVADALAERRA